MQANRLPFRQMNEIDITRRRVSTIVIPSTGPIILQELRRVIQIQACTVIMEILMAIQRYLTTVQGSRLYIFILFCLDYPCS